jgi:hypothetical protein
VQNPQRNRRLEIGSGQVDIFAHVGWGGGGVGGDCVLQLVRVAVSSSCYNQGRSEGLQLL